MKRPLPSKGNGPKSRKRRKTDPLPQVNSNGSTKQPIARHKIKLNEVKWKSVELPDRLDDFEGFYGLEEIDDVDVVRDPASGVISFETLKVDNDVAGDKEKELVERGVAATEQTWEGFSDGEIDVGDRMAMKPVESSVVSDANNNVEAKSGKENSKSKDLKLDSKAGAKNGGKSTKGKAQNRHENEEQALDVEGAFDILANHPTDDEHGAEVDVSAWTGLGLCIETLDALSKLGFSTPTPIQASSIPEILAGHDVIGKASTGSGKTLAFGIPILEYFLGTTSPGSRNEAPLALIISPTRELAHQITAHLTALHSGGSFGAPLIATITGGLSVQKQRRLLESAHIVIGTPGRLWEVMSSGHGLLKLFKQIRFLVVDEADRLLSEGHYKELGEILNVLEQAEESYEEDHVQEHPEPVRQPVVQRQTLVFSATFHKGLQQKLASKNHKSADLMSNQESMEYLLKKLRFREERPKLIDSNPQSQMASGLKEALIECAGSEKDLFLYTILLFHVKKRCLIFTNSISAVRRLTPFLQNLDLPALALHSQMPQKARLRSVERFSDRPGSILVATDVAARGLDIPGVQLIIHYHLPRAADTYVHRSGRTARAEASGSSILICAPEEVAGVRRLVAKVHSRSHQGKAKKTAYYIRTLDLDRRIVSRLKPRATLAKKLADAVIAKEKKHSEDDWMRAAAEDLGVDYDSETFEAEAKGKRGRGSGRKKKEREAQAMSKAEMQALRAELRALLAQRVNTGVSERYLTGGGIDVDKLLLGEGNLEFLGAVDGLDFGDE